MSDKTYVEAAQDTLNSVGKSISDNAQAAKEAVLGKADEAKKSTDSSSGGIGDTIKNNANWAGDKLNQAGHESAETGHKAKAAAHKEEAKSDNVSLSDRVQGGANYLGDKANEAKESAKGSADKAKAEAR